MKTNKKKQLKMHGVGTGENEDKQRKPWEIHGRGGTSQKTTNIAWVEST